MQPRIETVNEIKLVGNKLKMSFAHDRTKDLWQSFLSRRKQINNPVNSNLYSVEFYPDTHFYKNFNPTKEYEKWAAIQVSDFDAVQEEMERLIIPKGQYAVFHYKGKPTDAQQTFRYIYGVWLPSSEYEMDDRPFFALMGEKYKGEDPASEEEFWIPVKKK